MIYAKADKRLYNDLVGIFIAIGRCAPGKSLEVLQEELASRCTQIMGLPWMMDHKEPSEAAAAIICAVWLKQIEIVEDV